MLNKTKRFILALFMVFLINDICQYIRVLMNNDDFLSIGLFYTKTNNALIFNVSIIYLIVVSLITFFKYFFKEN